MDACTGISAIQLLAAALTFLVAVVWLDVFWVRISEELHDGDIAGALQETELAQCLRRRRRRRRGDPAAVLGHRLHQWRGLNLASEGPVPRGHEQKKKPGCEAGLFLRNTRNFQFNARSVGSGSLSADR